MASSVAMTDEGRDGDDNTHEETDERSLRIAFLMMTLLFSICHATVTTPIGYASSLLQKEIGNASNGALYGVTVVSSFALAPLVNGLIGPKWGLVTSMGAYTIYVAFFAAAVLSCAVPALDAQGHEAEGCEEGGSTQWILVMVGACIGGLGAGVLWTCQGAFFSAVVERMADVRQRRLQVGEATEESRKKVKEDVSGELSVSFAWYYLGLECIAKVIFTLLQKYAKMKAPTILFIYAGMSGAATLTFSFSKADMRNTTAPGPRPSVFAKASLAVALWKDPKIWLLMFTNFTFGFSVAWLNGYVNSNFLSKALNSTDFIGFLGAIIALIAAISSKVFGCLPQSCGKVPIVVLGAICFLLVGILSKISAPDGKGPGGWGWGIVVFYLLQGVGRGVYESTNKAIFADFFPGPLGPGAFANVMMQGTLSAAIAFFLQSANVNEPVLYLLLTFAVLTVPGLMAAHAVRSKEQQEIRQPVLRA